MTDTWRDRIVGARMSVDSQFTDRVEQSSFSRQQWGLVMTAVEFEIENADDPSSAEIVADTDDLPHVLPELDAIDEQMAAMVGGKPSSPGLFDGLKNALGLGSESSTAGDERKEEAVRLADEYAAALQTHLESTGRFDEIRELAASEA